MEWWVRLDPAIQAAWIGVVGALIGALIGASLGGWWTSKVARAASRAEWNRENELRAEQRREQQMQELMAAWVELHRSANRGSWEFAFIMDDPGPEEARRQLALFAEFWGHCKLVGLLSRAAGYPAAARFLYEMHHFEDDIQNTDARYQVAMEIAEQYLEHPDSIEDRLAMDPEGVAAQWIQVASSHRTDPEA